MMSASTKTLSLAKRKKLLSASWQKNWQKGLIYSCCQQQLTHRL